MRPKGGGFAFFQILILSVSLGLVAILFADAFLKGKITLDFMKGADPYAEIKEKVRFWKKDAPLVIIGKIINTNIQGQEYMTHMPVFEAVFYATLDIEEIERGSYPYPEIAVSIGWYSSTEPMADYPAYVKRYYRRGDRIRIYLYHDPQEGYYTPGCYYTMEPAGSMTEGLDQFTEGVSQFFKRIFHREQ